ncbi:hypothetical protein, partial [Pseudomonas viridiflava]|uniref:hypothetical protein n=1 Tax=Pseudomonas viridiflava TaxID=33069 RepID=UPI001980F263
SVVAARLGYNAEGMIGVLEITLIVPTLRVGMPLRTLRVRLRHLRTTSQYEGLFARFVILVTLADI